MKQKKWKWNTYQKKRLSNKAGQCTAQQKKRLQKWKWKKKVKVIQKHAGWQGLSLCKWRRGCKSESERKKSEHGTQFRNTPVWQGCKSENEPNVIFSHHFLAHHVVNLWNLCSQYQISIIIKWAEWTFFGIFGLFPLFNHLELKRVGGKRPFRAR